MYTLVTGASGVLGKAFCRLLAEKNKNLIVTGRSEDKLIALKNELLAISTNSEILCIACDISTIDGRQVLFDFCNKNNIVFDGLYNIAGVDTQMAFEKYTEEKLVFQTRVVYEATISITRFVLSKRADKLDILTISSLCGALPVPYFAIYSSLKGALVSFFDALRLELDKNKVKITTVLPGSIPTRPDIILDIKKQGLTGKLSSKSPEFVAKTSIIALKKGKKHYIPGVYNRFVNFIQLLTPKAIKMKVIASKFKIKEKDAF